MYYRALISVDFWEWDSEKNEAVLKFESNQSQGYDMCGFGALSLTETTPCVANDTYHTLLYAEKNKIKQWYFRYQPLPHITAAKDFQTIGSESAIITSIILSEDHSHTYVAFYEPDQPGLNGSVWVIDTDKGTVLKQYNNICYQPVKIMYKKK